MKNTKLITHGLLVLAIGLTFQLSLNATTPTKQHTATKAKGKRSETAKLLKNSANKHTTVQLATEEVKNYLQHLDKKYKLNLSFDEKNGLLTTTAHMIFLKAGNEAPSMPLLIGDLYKIKKSLKGHLRMFHAEKFTTPKTKQDSKLPASEMHRKLAKNTIRETTKDYLINSCGITDPQDVYTNWKLVKPLVNKKLDAASYRSDYDELLVPQTTVGKVLQAVYQELGSRGIRPKKQAKQQKIAQIIKKRQNKNEAQTVRSHPKKAAQKKSSLSRSKQARRSQPSRRPYRSRKNIERSISLEQAKNMVQEHVERLDLSKTDRIYLQEQITKAVSSLANPKGFIYPRRALQVITDGIAQFKKLKKVVKPQQEMANAGLADEGEE